ncbi:MAG: AsmA-like C-terminal region-containing protein [Gemmataceae bacterium]
MRQARRWLRNIAIFLGGLALVGLIAAHFVLNSAYVRGLASRQLSELLGMPVEVNRLHLGTSISANLRVLQPDNSPLAGAQFIAIDSADADVSLLDIIRRRVEPSRLILRGVAVLVELNADGSMVTQLPHNKASGSPIPSIQLEDARLTVRQPGRPEFELTGMSADVRPNEQTLVISGTANDPHWGNWQLTGEISPRTNTGRLEANSERLNLDVALLRSLPMVPEEIWNQVQPSGPASGQLKLWIEANSIHYSADIRPHDGALKLPPIDAVAERISGEVRIQDLQVELINCKAAVAGGAVNLNGVMDFAPEPSVVHLKVGIDGADVRQLPHSWGLPPQLEGKLRGSADLSVRLPANGPIETSGDGDAVIQQAKVAGTPAEIRLKLRSHGRGYRFDQDQQTAPNDSRRPPDAGRVFLMNMRQQPQKPPPPTTLDVKITLPDAEVAELLQRFDLKIPYRVSGKVSVNATMTMPLSGAAPNEVVRFSGSAKSVAIAVEGLTIRGLTAQVVYRDGQFDLTSLRGHIASAAEGTLSGTAHASMTPRGDLTARLDLIDVPLAEIEKAIPGLTLPVQGKASASVDARVPLDQASTPAAWTGSIQFDAREFLVAQRRIHDARLVAKVRNGAAAISQMNFKVEENPISVSGQVNLVRPYHFELTAKTSGPARTDLHRLLPELHWNEPLNGRLEFDARASGDLDSMTYVASGRVKLADLFAGPGNEVNARWEMNSEHLVVRDLSAIDGAIAGHADIPFSNARAGDFSLALSNVDSALIDNLVPDLPIRLAGRVSGHLTGTFPRGPQRRPTAKLELSGERLTVNRFPTNDVAVSMNVDSDRATYRVVGGALGGRFEASGRYPLTGQQNIPDDRGSFRLTNADLGRLARDLNMPALAPLRGRFDFGVEFDEDMTAGNGQLSARGLKWGDASPPSAISASVVVREGSIGIDNIDGTLAGGRLRGRGTWNRREPDRSMMILTLDRASARQLAAPFSTLAGHAEGDVSMTLRTRFGRNLHGSAQILLTGGRLFGTSIPELRAPFDWAAGRALTEISFHDIAAQAGDGRITGEFSYTKNDIGRMRGQLRFTEVRLQSLLSDVSQLRGGRASGRFDFADNPIRTASDVGGTLIATLNQTSVTETPILRTLTPFLSPTGALQPFESGDLRARLANGVFRIERFALANPGAQLFAEGSITLHNQRLDLDVVANTGQMGPNVRILQLAGLAVPAVGPISATVVKQASDFLSYRTVRLTVTGTVATPVVQVNTAALLSDEAVRFFVTRYALP